MHHGGGGGRRSRTVLRFHGPGRRRVAPPRAGDRGAQALAALKDAPALHALVLDLGFNAVEHGGARALAALKDAPALHVLTLNLLENSVGDAGAQALAAVRHAKALHTLTLNLSTNAVGDCGAQVAPPAFSQASAVAAVAVSVSEWQQIPIQRPSSSTEPIRYVPVLPCRTPSAPPPKPCANGRPRSSAGHAPPQRACVLRGGAGSPPTPPSRVSMKPDA